MTEEPGEYLVHSHRPEEATLAKLSVFLEHWEANAARVMDVNDASGSVEMLPDAYFTLFSE